MTATKSSPPPVRLYLDDVRDPPSEGWTVARTAEQARAVMLAGPVAFASLDHDLGICERCTPGTLSSGGVMVISSLEGVCAGRCSCACHQTGYDFALWMAETGNWPAEKPVCHSANPVGKERIEGVIARYYAAPDGKRVRFDILPPKWRTVTGSQIDSNVANASLSLSDSLAFLSSAHPLGSEGWNHLAKVKAAILLLPNPREQASQLAAWRANEEQRIGQLFTIDRQDAEIARLKEELAKAHTTEETMRELTVLAVRRLRADLDRLTSLIVEAADRLRGTVGQPGFQQTDADTMRLVEAIEKACYEVEHPPKKERRGWVKSTAALGQRCSICKEIMNTFTLPLVDTVWRLRDGEEEPKTGIYIGDHEFGEYAHKACAESSEVHKEPAHAPVDNGGRS